MVRKVMCCCLCSSFSPRIRQIPWIEIPIDYDVRAKPRSIASLTGTKGELGGWKKSFDPRWTADERGFRSANGQHHLQSALATVGGPIAHNLPRARVRLRRTGVAEHCQWCVLVGLHCGSKCAL